MRATSARNAMEETIKDVKSTIPIFDDAVSEFDERMSMIRDREIERIEREENRKNRFARVSLFSADSDEFNNNSTFGNPFS